MSAQCSRCHFLASHSVGSVFVVLFAYALDLPASVGLRFAMMRSVFALFCSFAFGAHANGMYERKTQMPMVYLNLHKASAAGASSFLAKSHEQVTAQPVADAAFNFNGTQDDVAMTAVKDALASGCGDPCMRVLRSALDGISQKSAGTVSFSLSRFCVLSHTMQPAPLFAGCLG